MLLGLSVHDTGMNRVGVFLPKQFGKLLAKYIKNYSSRKYKATTTH